MSDRCDFCSATVPLVRTFTVPKDTTITAEMQNGDTWIDDGQWGACADCAKLIETKQWSELVKRGKQGLIRVNPQIVWTVEKVIDAERRVWMLLDIMFPEDAPYTSSVLSRGGEK